MDKILQKIIKLTEEGKLDWVKSSTNQYYDDNGEMQYSDKPMIIFTIKLPTLLGNVRYTEISFDNDSKLLIVTTNRLEDMYIIKSEYLYSLLNFPNETKELLNNLEIIDKGSTDIYGND